MPLLSVIVPAYNERDNLVPLTTALASALTGIDYEVVIVDDDSPDGTGALARRLAQDNPRIRVIQRIGRRGLASAVIEGALSTSSPYIAVIDADLQHDERILPSMLAKLRDERLDLVVGSRHVGDGGMGDLSSDRVKLSNAGRRLFEADLAHARLGPDERLLRADARRSSTRSPTRSAPSASRCSWTSWRRRSGRFASARSAISSGHARMASRSSTSSSSWSTWSCSSTRSRAAGFRRRISSSASSARPGWPSTSWPLRSLLRVWDLEFLRAQAIGALLTVAVNFFLNNATTFRSARMRGAQIVTGLLLFYAVCSVALLAQLAVASALQQFGVHWAPATLVGIVIGSVWNYTIAAQLVWRVHRGRFTQGQ